MKKALILLLLVGMVAPVFADDALVLPNRVIRFRTIPALFLTSQTFDQDGNKQDITRDVSLGALGTQTFTVDSVNVWALNFALEVGVSDQINVAAQWTPGWQFASTTSATAPDAVVQASPSTATTVVNSIENAQSTGLNDLFVGAKIQILGDSGYVPNESMRLATSVGVKIPLSIYDANDALSNQNDGNEYQAGPVDRDALGFGFRVHYDYIFSEMFYLNLFSETQFFLPRDIEQVSNSQVVKNEYKYGYQQAFEIDPSATLPINDGLRLAGGLAARYTMTPDIEVDGTSIDDSATQLLTVTPRVGAFFTGLPVPLEAKVQYTLPVYGVNARATNALAVQLNTYLRF